jgi:hypothetical protein
MYGRSGLSVSLAALAAFGLLTGCGDDGGDGGGDTTPPNVTSIVRADASPTNADTLDFTVTFDESVTGVDATDFAVTATGSTPSPSGP